MSFREILESLRQGPEHWPSARETLRTRWDAEEQRFESFAARNPEMSRHPAAREAAERVRDAFADLQDALDEAFNASTVGRIEELHRSLDRTLLDFRDSLWIARGPTPLAGINAVCDYGTRFMTGQLEWPTLRGKAEEELASLRPYGFDPAIQPLLRLLEQIGQTQNDAFALQRALQELATAGREVHLPSLPEPEPGWMEQLEESLADPARLPELVQSLEQMRTLARGQSDMAQAAATLEVMLVLTEDLQGAVEDSDPAAQHEILADLRRSWKALERKAEELPSARRTCPNCGQVNENESRCRFCQTSLTVAPVEAERPLRSSLLWQFYRAAADHVDGGEGRLEAEVRGLADRLRQADAVSEAAPGWSDGLSRLRSALATGRLLQEAPAAHLLPGLLEDLQGAEGALSAWLDRKSV